MVMGTLKSTQILSPLFSTPRTDGPYSSVSVIPPCCASTSASTPPMNGHDDDTSEHSQFHRRGCITTRLTGAIDMSVASSLLCAWKMYGQNSAAVGLADV